MGNVRPQNSDQLLGFEGKQFQPNIRKKAKPVRASLYRNSLPCVVVQVKGNVFQRGERDDSGLEKRLDCLTSKVSSLEKG